MTLRTPITMITWLATTLWFAAIAAAGAAAAGVFAILPGLEPTLAEYRALDPALHGRLASGLITEPIFTATDIAQIVMSIIVIACVSAFWLLGLAAGRPLSRIAWSIASLGAVACLWIRIIFVMPGMNADLQRYRAAAREGDAEQATLAYDAFNAMHPTASSLMELSAVLLLIAIAALAACCTPAKSRRNKA